MLGARAPGWYHLEEQDVNFHSLLAPGKPGDTAGRIATATHASSKTKFHREFVNSPQAAQSELEWSKKRGFTLKLPLCQTGGGSEQGEHVEDGPNPGRLTD